MKVLIYITIVGLALCNNPGEIFKIPAHTANDSLIIPKDSFTLYFPSYNSKQDSIKNINALDSFLNSWYSRMLFALHEPVLSGYSGNKDIFRFTWLRTFNNPVAIRIQKDGASISLHVKRSGGAGGYDPGRIITDTVIPVSDHQWNEFITKFTAINFWKFPVLKEEDRGTDGSEWILEAAVDDKYHFASRYMPRYSAFSKCCVYLIELSQLKIPADERY